MSGWQQPKSRASTGVGALSASVGDSSAAIKEQRALEAMKARRQQELEQMMAYELKSAQVAADHEAQMEAEAEAARERERVKMEKHKLWEEAQRQKELDKAAAEAEVFYRGARVIAYSSTRAERAFVGCCVYMHIIYMEPG